MLSLFDRTHWGRIRLTGRDRIRFLHNQTTNNIEQIPPGEGCSTVFVTSTGRTIDLSAVYAFDESLLVITSPGMAQQIHDWMDRYIFFSDKVTLSDESDQTFMFTLIGEGAAEIVEQLGFTDIPTKLFSHQTVHTQQFKSPIIAAAGSGLAMAGFTMWGDRADAGTIWNQIVAAGATQKTLSDWELLRIQQGRPTPGAELTDDDNPLEAGLWDSISFEKGCYIGQETIARLNTYKGVKKKLWGLQLKDPIEEGTDLSKVAIAVDGRKIGRITSLKGDGRFALGYIRTKAGGEGTEVEIVAKDADSQKADSSADSSTDSSTDSSVDLSSLTQAKVIPLPFIHHEYYEPDS